MRWAFICLTMVMGLVAGAASATPDFAREVRPILERSCFGCHGPERQKSGYRLDERDFALKGGDSGKAAIVPHSAKTSPLIRFVSGEDEEILMPPAKSERPRLTAAEVRTLRDWIDAGPAWPDELAGGKPTHWSLRPLVKPVVPVISESVISRSATSKRTATLRTDSLITSPDPDNRLLAHFPTRRLEFEQVRDAMLSVSGELNLTMGGKPAELLDAGNKRRTVYAFVDRQFLAGTFRTFDFANPDIHVAVRHETTVPQQALFFLNGAFAADRSRALAKLFTNAPPKERVQKLHQALYQRAASKTEIAAALRFVKAAEVAVAPEPPPVRATQWRYGTGEYDEGAMRLKSFTPLPHFTGSSWQGAAAFPGGESGWAQLTAEGGHPGNTRAHACVRRWVAPRDATVNIAGILKHEPEQGDGVRAFIVSSRHGELNSATAHKSKADLSATNILVKAGDLLDFIVDIGGTLNSDQFLWVPVIKADETSWDARAEFDGPRPAPEYLTAWEQYAQVLLLANEFAFVD